MYIRVVIANFMQGLNFVFVTGFSDEDEGTLYQYRYESDPCYDRNTSFIFKNGVWVAGAFCILVLVPIPVAERQKGESMFTGTGTGTVLKKKD